MRHGTHDPHAGRRGPQRRPPRSSKRAVKTPVFARHIISPDDPVRRGDDHRGVHHQGEQPLLGHRTADRSWVWARCCGHRRRSNIMLVIGSRSARRRSASAAHRRPAACHHLSQDPSGEFRADVHRRGAGGSRRAWAALVVDSIYHRAVVIAQRAPTSRGRSPSRRAYLAGDPHRREACWRRHPAGRALKIKAADAIREE